MVIQIYTDGAQSSKTKCGGWGVAIPPYAHNFCTEVAYGYEENTTNQRMELTGFLNALQWCIDNQSLDTEFVINTDSAYIYNCITEKWYLRWRTNGWKTATKAPVLNKDLWVPILQYIEGLGARLTVQKVAGHSHDKYNDIADKVAVHARTHKINGTANVDIP